MSNIVYGNPFGAALEGKRAALSDVLKAGEASRQQRDQDLNYDFMKWYQPLKQAEAQSQVGSSLFKQFASLGHYTGNYDPLNATLMHYFGVPAETIPAAFQGGKAGAPQTKAADLASGLLPTAFAYPDVAGAGGAWRGIPQAATQGTGDPELDALYRQLHIKQVNDALHPPTAAPLPHLNPLGSITPGASLPSKIEPLWSDPGSGVAPPSPQDAYGLRPPKPAASSFSPWADEYQPPVPQPEETDGTE